MANKTENLTIFQLISTTDHDKQVKIEGQELYCYSPKQLKKLYPEKNYNVVGETRASNKKKAVAQLRAGKKTLVVSEVRTFTRLFNKCVGYARTAQDDYVALYENRLPFLIILFLLLLGLILAGGLLLRNATADSGGPEGPVVIVPDHPMPDQDTNAKPNEGDDSQKAEAEEGGGSLSMIYSLDAALDLNTGEIRMYFMNPNASTHDVSIILYVVSGETEVPIAQSGRVSAGYSLSSMTMEEGSARLFEGMYKGYYLLSLFDPETGERALVQPEITGVKLTVTD